MSRQNVTGRQISFWRNKYDWSQEELVAKIECKGYYISRSTLAMIERGQRVVSDELLVIFSKVFQVPLDCLFSPEIQKLSAKYAQRLANTTH